MHGAKCYYSSIANLDDVSWLGWRSVVSKLALLFIRIAEPRGVFCFCKTEALTSSQSITKKEGAKDFLFPSWAGGIRSRSATPRFHDCKHSLHRKVALRTATGSPHPLMPGIRVFQPSSHTKKISVDLKAYGYFLGWAGGIRTPECQDQNLVPYHLATAHCYV